jgi:hypothetical protein
MNPNLTHLLAEVRLCILLMLVPCVMVGCIGHKKQKEEIFRDIGESFGDTVRDVNAMNEQFDTLPQAMSLTALGGGNEVLLTRDAATGRDHAAAGGMLQADADRIELDAAQQTLHLEGAVELRLGQPDGKNTLMQAKTMRLALQGAAVRDERTTTTMAPAL